MPVSWTDVETALIRWVKDAAGCEAIFAEQKGTQPELPYATVKVTGPRNAAGPWPRSIQGYNPGAPAGQEVTFRAVVDREITVTVQFFAGSPIGDTSARALAEKTRMALALGSVLEGLRGAGLAVADVGDTYDLTKLVETSFQGRAALDVRMRLADDVTETTTYIERAGVTGSYE